MGLREKIARMIAPGLKNDAEIRDIVTEEIQRAKMMLPITANYDPKYEGYRPLSGSGGMQRELLPMTQSRMFEIAYYMYDNSAMTRSLAHMDRAFLFAEPITIISKDEEVQKIIDRFCEDPENNFYVNYPDRAMWLSLLGEQCWPVDVNPANGHVRIQYADPGEIKEVWVNPLNVTQRMRVDLQGRDGKPGKMMPVIRKDYNINSKTYDRLVGECFFFTINHPPNASRGRSDFLTLFDWIDGLERYTFNYMERAEFLLNYIWDVTLKGMNEDQIREWIRNNPAPDPGSMRAHNENVDWNVVAPDLKAQDFKNGYDMGKSFIMGAARRPDSWFGEGGKAYQTEAEQFGQVPIKDLDLRQLYHKHNIIFVIQFVVDQSVIKGRLSPEKAAAGFEVWMPEISKKDLTKMMNGIPQMVAALTLAVNAKLISRNTAITFLAFVAGQLGYEIDAQAEIDAALNAPPEDEIDYEKKYLENKGRQ